MQANHNPPFAPGIRTEAESSDSDLWFVFHEDQMVIKGHEGTELVLDHRDIAALQGQLSFVNYFGLYQRRRCFCAGLNARDHLPSGFDLGDLRAMRSSIDEELFVICGTALQVLNWDRNHQFCGRCGTPTTKSASDRAKICPSCSQRHYPRISPAIITAVVRDSRILLAKNKNFKAGFYSVIAGFVEPGESLEQCVQREIHEEVGLGVANIHYFGSQPWPFPDSLMLAFTAEWASGEIAIDNDEIIAADWFTPATFPAIPPPGSISRKLIDWYSKTVS